MTVGPNLVVATPSSLGLDGIFGNLQANMSIISRLLWDFALDMLELYRGQ
jgi:hypothetical protein